MIFHGKLLNVKSPDGNLVFFLGSEALYSVAGTWELVSTSLVIVSPDSYEDSERIMIQQDAGVGDGSSIFINTFSGWW